MKKIYLSAAALAAVSIVSAQLHQGVMQKEAFEQPGESVQAVKEFGFLNGKASGDILWEENFANGLAGNNASTPSTWTVGGPQAIWAYDTDGPNGQFSATTQRITSTTVLNGFIIFDADANQTPSPGTGFYAHQGWIESPAIDLSAAPANATLTFQHTYRHCCSQTFFPRVEVSDNNFTTSTSFNVSISGVNVNTIAPTTTQKVHLANWLASAANPGNVKFRFVFDGVTATNGTHYWWQVDDIAIIETYDNDLRQDSRVLAMGAFELPYHFVPATQMVPVSLSGEIFNDGATQQTGVQLEFTAVTGGVPTVLTSNPSTLNPGVLDSVVTSATWNPGTVVGTNYELTWRAIQNETEEFPADNQRLDIFRVTDTVFARDNNTVLGSFTNVTSNTNQQVKIGNVMEFNASTYITSLSIYVANSQPSIGQEIFGEVRSFQGGTDYVFEAETDFHTIVAGNLGSWVTLKLQDPVPVEAGADILVLAGHNGSGNPAVTDPAIGMSRAVPTGSVLGYDAGDGLFQLLDPRAIMVRPNINNNVSVEELANESLYVSSNFPNPFATTTSVDFKLQNATNVSYSIVDMTGKTVLAVSNGNMAAGSHQIKLDGSSWANGIYYFTVKTDDAQITRKIVVNR